MGFCAGGWEDGKMVQALSPLPVRPSLWTRLPCKRKEVGPGLYSPVLVSYVGVSDDL